MSSKILDGPDVVAYGMFRKITTLEFFQHRFAKMGHGNTSCDPHLYQSHQATNAPLPHAKRPPRSGYVLTAIADKCNPLRNRRNRAGHFYEYPTTQDLVGCCEFPSSQLQFKSKGDARWRPTKREQSRRPVRCKILGSSDAPMLGPPMFR